MQKKLTNTTNLKKKSLVLKRTDFENEMIELKHFNFNGYKRKWKRKWKRNSKTIRMMVSGWGGNKDTQSGFLLVPLSFLLLFY